MALTLASLSTKIQTELIAQFGAADDAAILKKVADAIAKAVVDEIKANAVVTTTVTGTLPTGPVAATGTGTVT